ncbi:E3 ubiquitin-protein ligase TRIM56-like [Hypanus sabinus]|uniref:E3 ubiquitin-protein ligase TRIM56-like n=1 Tax=Hypanus sabinus TaxID=79690 RepID=UPI0028C49060|nr:E3 ubiquitin-protein ligase TRIM56-like [Hypanus sabinus]XP_059809603.1 E3 ubiquitin-protein ligase TRIM56-like [Hypanus sabinus]XP_059809604.1 E3 ubiquitin-protein ligase TRIM56-like [Hypanus sabinus]
MATSLAITDQIENDILNCKICFNRFNQPKMLPCAHTYCFDCLENMVRGNRKIRCPECREEADVSGGVSKLKTNFQINSLLDIFKGQESEEAACSPCAIVGKSRTSAAAQCQTCCVHLCLSCKVKHTAGNPGHVLTSLPGFSSGPCEAEVAMQKKVYCQQHPRALVDYFCTSCNSAICASCSSYSHAQHKRVPVAKTVATTKPMVTKLVGRLRTELQSLARQDDSLNDAVNKLKATECSLMSMIESTLTEVINNLIKQGDGIKVTVADYVRKQEELYKNAKTELHHQIKKAEETREFAERILQSGQAREIVCLQSIVEEHINAIQALKAAREEKNSPSLKVNESIKKEIFQSNLFSITFEGESIPQAQTTPARTEQNRSSAKTPQAWVPVPQPRQRVSSMFSFDTELSNDDCDPKLTGISVASDGTIIVVDEGNSILKCYTDTGYFIRVIELPDDEDDPCSVAVFDDTIACSAGNKLYFLDLDGGFLKKLFLRGSESVYPIAAYEDEYVAVSEGALCSLSLYDVDGHVVSRVKPIGYEGVRFLFLAINSLEEFIVADSGKKCIVIFNRYGEVLTLCDQITLNGLDCALKPYSICTDVNDNILVTERNRILLFWPDGTFREELLNTGNGLHKPRVIAVNDEDSLIVTQGNGFVSLYKLDLS